MSLVAKSGRAQPQVQCRRLVDFSGSWADGFGGGTTVRKGSGLLEHYASCNELEDGSACMPALWVARWERTLLGHQAKPTNEEASLLVSLA